MKGFADLPSQIRSLLRFPVPVAIAVSLALTLNLELAHVLKLNDSLEAEIIIISPGAFLAGVAANLWAISRGYAGSIKLGVTVAACASAGAIEHFHGEVYNQNLVALLGLALAVMVAGYLRRNARIESFWHFNLQLGSAVAMALVALLIVCGGLSLVVASLSFLFDFNLDHSYGYIWSTGCTLFAPLYALSMVPVDFDERFVLSAEPNLIERSVSSVINFALIPLILIFAVVLHVIFAVVLHVYALKIAVLRAMPKGEIGWMVVAFGVIGTATYMISYPWRDAGFRAVRWFMRWWCWLMIVPTTLLVLAAWQRINQYGVTPERYCLVLFALWLAAMAGCMAWARGRIDLRVIPASLAVGLIISSFGPWGAIAVSVRSQLEQLRIVLNQQKLLDDGKLKLYPPRLATFKQLVAANKRVASIVTSLYDLDALERLAAMFSSVTDSPFANPQEAEARLGTLGLSTWGFPLNSSPSRPPVTAGITVDTRDYDRLIGPFWIRPVPAGLSGCVSGCSWSDHLAIGEIALSRSGNFVTASQNGDKASFDIASVFDPKPRDPAGPEWTVTREACDGNMPALLIVVRPSPDYPSTQFEGWILLKPRALVTKQSPDSPGD